MQNHTRIFEKYLAVVYIILSPQSINRPISASLSPVTVALYATTLQQRSNVEKPTALENPILLVLSLTAINYSACLDANRTSDRLCVPARRASARPWGFIGLQGYVYICVCVGRYRTRGRREERKIAGF